MNNSKDKIYYTWEQFDKDVLVFSKQLVDKKFYGIVGLSRGGVTLATALSYSLGINNVYYFEPKARLLFGEKLYGGKYLIVDDINDSGDTLKQVKQHQEEYHLDFEYLTIFYKTYWSNFKELNYYRHEISEEDSDKWVVFPWEEQFNHLR